MNNIKARKYARTSKKINTPTPEGDEAEFSLSATAALSLLGGTFLVGVLSGKLLHSMCTKKF